MARTTKTSRGKRLLKWIGVGLGTILLLGVALAIGVYIYLGTDAGKSFVKEKIVEAAKESIRGELSIGEISDNPLSGLDLRDVALRSPDGKPVLSAESIAVDYSLVDVLGETTLVEKLTLTGATLHLRRRADGTLELQSMLIEKESTGTLIIESLVLHNCTVILSDESLLESPQHLEAINGELRLESGVEETKINIKTLLGQWRQQQLPLRIAGTSRLTKRVIEVENFSFGLGQAALEIRSLVAPTEADQRIQANANIRVDVSSLHRLGVKDVEKPIEAALVVTGTGNVPKVTLTAEQGKANVRVDASADIVAKRADATVTVDSLRLASYSSQMPFSVPRATVRLALSKLDQSQDAVFDVSAKGAVVSGRAGTVDFDMTAKGAERAGRVTMELRGKRFGKVSASARGAFREKLVVAASTIKGSFDLGVAKAILAPSLDVSGQLVVDASVHGSPAAITASGSVRSKRARYGEIAARDMETTFDIELRNRRPRGSAALTLARVDDGNYRWRNVRVKVSDSRQPLERMKIGFSVDRGPHFSALRGSAWLRISSHEVTVSRLGATATAFKRPWRLQLSSFTFASARIARLEKLQVSSPSFVSMESSATMLPGRRWRARALQLQLDLPDLAKLSEIEKLLREQNAKQGAKQDGNLVSANLHGRAQIAARFAQGELTASAKLVDGRFRSLSLDKAEVTVRAPQGGATDVTADAYGKDVGTITLQANGRLGGRVDDIRTYVRLSPSNVNAIDFEWKDTKLKAVGEFAPAIANLGGHARGQVHFARDRQTRKARRFDATVELVDLLVKNEVTPTSKNNDGGARRKPSAARRRSVNISGDGYRVRVEANADARKTSVRISAGSRSATLMRIAVSAQTTISRIEHALLSQTSIDAPISGDVVAPQSSVALLARAFGVRMDLQGTLAGKFTVSGRLRKPRLNGEFRGSNLALAGKKLPDLFLGAQMLPGAQDKAWLRLSQKTGGRLSFTARSFLDREKGQFVAEANAFELSFLNDIFLKMRIPVALIKGTIVGKAEGKLWQASRTQGNLQVRDGRISLPKPVETLESFAATLAVSSREYLMKMQGKAEDGTVQLSVRVPAANWWPRAVRAQLKLEDLPLSTAGLNATVDGAASLEAKFAKDGWKGKVNIESLAIDLPSLPQGTELHPVGKLEDVVFVHQSSESKKSGGMFPAADIAITSGPKAIKVTNSLATVIAGIDMKLLKRRDAEELTLTGKVKSSGGQVTILDRKYKIKRGLVDFDRGVDGTPYVDVLIEREFQKARIGINVTGVPPDFEFLLRSDPDVYTESQMISLVASGRASETNSGMGTALSAVAGLAGKEFLDRINSPISVDSVSVDTGDDGAVSSLAVGKWLTSDIFLSYHLNFNPDQTENEDEARLEWWLAPRWLFEVRAGDAGAASSDLLWIYRF